jgi:hypothetical protein
MSLPNACLLCCREFVRVTRVCAGATSVGSVIRQSNALRTEAEATSLPSRIVTTKPLTKR